MSNIYVVMGTTGEYSDRSEWPVIAFVSEEAAKERIEKATHRAKELEATIPSNYEMHVDHFKQNEFDPDMQHKYTGTEYYYLKVELFA